MRRVRALLLTVSVVSTPAFAQAWPDPYTGNTVGALLETEFKRVVKECGLPSLRAPNRLGFLKDKTAIPTVVRDHVGVSRRYLLRKGESASRVFGYIQSTPSVGSGLIDPAHYLSIDMESDPIAMLAPGISHVAYTHTCSSVINAALAANLGLPIGDLKAALATEYGKQQQSVIALVEGQYFSPIAALLQGTAADRTFARLLFWDWYSKNSAAANSPQYYVTSLAGFTLYEFTRIKRDVNGQVDLSAGYAVPGLASIKGMIKAGVLTSDATDLKAYGTVIYVDPAGPVAQTNVVPGPASLAAALSQVRASAKADSPLVLQNKPNLHSAEIHGMPPALCSVNSWVLDAVPQPGMLTLRSADVLENQTSCRFGVSFVAAPSVFTAATSDLILQYAIASTNTIGGNRVRFAVPQINLTTSSSPMILLGQVNPMSSRREIVQNGVTQTDLLWYVPIAIDDALNPLNPAAQVSIKNASLSCEQGEIPISVSPSIQVSPQRTATLVISHTVTAIENLDLEGAPRSCHFSATSTLSLQNGSTATRSLPTADLLYPAKKPETPPTPPPGVPPPPPPAPRAK